MAFRGARQSFMRGRGLWSQLHVCVGGRAPPPTLPFLGVEKLRPGPGQRAPGQPQMQRSPGGEACSIHPRLRLPGDEWCGGWERRGLE